MDPEEKHDPVVASMGEEGSVDLPLGETTLTSNLGVPIIVVCAKVHMRERVGWVGGWGGS